MMEFYRIFWEFHVIFLTIFGISVKCVYVQILLSKSESVEFPLIESVICLFTDSSVQKYFSLTNQLIFTD